MADEQSNETPEDGRGRLSRLRFKKKDMPGGLWMKCEGCATTIYRKELEEKGMVCPKCGFHFTLPGRKRVEATLDEGTFEELFADLTSLDRLEFVDSVPYADKIARTVQRTGQNEALICGKGEIHGRPVVLAVLDFKFLGGSMGEVVGEKIALAADVARRDQLPLVVFTSNLLSKLMDRYAIIVWIGAAILGKVGGEMVITDHLFFPPPAAPDAWLIHSVGVAAAGVVVAAGWLKSSPASAKALRMSSALLYWPCSPRIFG